jgi:hypothetical protein
MTEHVVRDVPRGNPIGVVESITRRWWKGFCFNEAHDAVSADTRSKAADELRRHARKYHGDVA